MRGGINVTSIIVGVGAGGMDEVLEWQDEENARTEPFKKWTDWGRIGLCLLGYIGQAFNVMPSIAAPLAQSELALVTKTVGSAIRSRVATESAISHPRTKARITQTPRPGFEGLRTY